MNPRILFTLAAAFAFALSATSAHAAAGELDPTFGGVGKFQTIIQSNLDEAADVLVQPDGKIVAAGTTVNSGQRDFALTRYNLDGSLDPGFGSGGKVVLNPAYAAHSTFGEAIALQPDGKIVIVGSSLYGGDYDFVVARVLSNGAKDDAFGTAGYYRHSFGLGGSNNDYANDVALQPDGQIVVAGTASKVNGSNFAVLRLTPGGVPTAGLNGGTAITFPIGSEYDGIESVAIQPDGKIVVAGDTYNGSEYDFALARISSGGLLDTSFGPNHTGKVDLGVGSEDSIANDLVLQQDGKLIVAGYAEIAGTYRGVLVRFGGDGSVDSSFGGAGIAVPPPGAAADTFNSLALLRSGKVVAGGYWSSSGLGLSIPAGPLVTRFNSDGSVDSTFGSGGSTRSAETPGGTAWNSIALAPDGKLAAAGEDGNSNGNGTGGTYSVGRYTADPPPAPPKIALKSTIAKSLKGKIKAKKLKKFSGTASGTGIAKVQIAIQKTDSKLLKKKKRCLFVKSNTGKTKSYKAKKKKCSTPSKWLTAKGTTKWSYSLRGKLKTGKYTLYVRALDSAGVPQAKLTRRNFQIVK